MIQPRTYRQLTCLGTQASAAADKPSKTPGTSLLSPATRPPVPADSSAHSTCTATSSPRRLGRHQPDVKFFTSSSLSTATSPTRSPTLATASTKSSPRVAASLHAIFLKPRSVGLPGLRAPHRRPRNRLARRATRCKQDFPSRLTSQVAGHALPCGPSSAAPSGEEHFAQRGQNPRAPSQTRTPGTRPPRWHSRSRSA